MNPDQQTALDAVMAIYRNAAPHGWLRIVCRWESELDEDGDARIAATHVAIVADGSGLEQVQIARPREAVFPMRDFLDELTHETESGTLCVDLIIDRDSHAVTFTEEPSKMLQGDFDDSDESVHNYLENHRSELEALAARA